MTDRILTNEERPYDSAIDVTLEISLIGPDGRVQPIISDDATEWGTLIIAPADMTDGVFTQLLPVNDDTNPASQYRVEMTQTWTNAAGNLAQYVDRSHSQVLDGVGSLQWQDFYRPGTANLSCADWNLTLAHATRNGQVLTERDHLPSNPADSQFARYNATTQRWDAVTVAPGGGGIEFVAAPASPTDSGSQGQMAWLSPYLYLCVAANTWTRWTPARTW